MSSDKDPLSSANGDKAQVQESSITDSQTPPRRFEPITREMDDDEPADAAGTIRWNRPSHIASDTGNTNYGMTVSTCS